LIPYTQYFKNSPYLQQGTMESNGKSVGRDGNPVNYETGTIIWGEPGLTHSMLFSINSSRNEVNSSDFIGFVKPLYGDEEHHDKLIELFCTNGSFDAW
jgi:glucose-6-phosphate isomerase